ncbi:phosphatidylinositol mannoside acyltransferase [Mycobacteroides chelonae]|uniref:phosphatidylinositol mannoside acyltransferase n=1 Tax=Mycobacteroides chelonae TaxID=1774 RepID=UPI0004AB97FB|nr:phosphatidylinositol mannoside acyltransferase [Mycobacteroides chelonae]OHT73869.1 phosphatidylinositol mannoside acyltransferase [Mycobacteroides chelonae]OHT76424.1 phosphatidylinositol mannoside acyltransferase [Mycobacteroides chelonae]OHT91718.1 phosphatidylinositol mannoside acyltransferase [Mycobacteroides chelonae]OHU17620.1 phosphatidylinositol mannoside acyltransferase [Mycobacteroides chelonae]
MSVWGERAADWGYAAGWNLTQMTPDLLARAIFDVGAMVGARNGGPEQLRKNLARVLGVHPREVPDRLMIDSMRSYARYWREAFRLPSHNMERLAARLDSSLFGRRNLDESQAQGRGTIIALPHSGNWDMAGVWLAQTYGTFTTVAERLKPESLYRRFLDYRETLGFEVLASSGDSTGPYETLATRLRENRVVCLMADRDLSRSGVPVDFFGAEARMPAGPARLAIDTGARLLPAHCWFEPHGQWGVRIQAPIDTSSGDVSVVIQALADEFAANIAERPADWHMLQPLWLDDLSEERRTRLRTTPAQPASEKNPEPAPESDTDGRAAPRETDPVGGQA